MQSNLRREGIKAFLGFNYEHHSHRNEEQTSFVFTKGCHISQIKYTYNHCL